jgi:hypothetical protein
LQYNFQQSLQKLKVGKLIRPAQNSSIFQGCNPSYVIYPTKSSADFLVSSNLLSLAPVADPADRQDHDHKHDHRNDPQFDLYIDLNNGRGNDVVKRLRRAIVLSPNRPTLQFMAGAIGSGKTTELLRLKLSLEQQGFVVIYSRADEYLPLGDVRVTEIWILLLYLVAQQTERQSNSALPLSYLPNAIAEIEAKINLNADGGSTTTSNSSHRDEFSYVLRLGKILRFLQNLSQQRFQLRHYLESPLEPQLKGYLLMAAEELVGKEIERLKQVGKKGLVILIDNLDRLSEEQAQQIFNTGSKYLQQFPCHTIYTLPVISAVNSPNNDLSLNNARNNARLSPSYFVLPELRLCDRQGEINADVLALLRQVVLARVLPQVLPEMRFEQISQAFADLETLDHLCVASEGYLPHLISLLYGCWQLQEPPFAHETVAAIVNDFRQYRT